MPAVFAGCGGLGSRDVRPGHIVAIFENMRKADGKRFFTLNVNHPTALPPVEDPDVRPVRLVLDARPLGRRLRLDYDEQDHRVHLVRPLRAERAGLPALRR